MSSLATFKNPATYHILSYGTLIGSTLFQSFIAGIIAFRSLPRPQFSTLQKNTFPAYFALQTACPLLLALTYPRPGGASSLLSSSPENKLPFYLIATMLLTGAANLLYVGPKTTQIMKLRKHQETRDGKKSYDAGPHSEGMKELNRRFGVLHGVSSLVNLVGLGAMVWYGGLLGEWLGL
ncbi:hypothetical protein BU24DRAFT_416099 [Aaosphaeria arxii CBS 175.79]|uniref:TMEM205-like domain-containing protein n=1 Tax=Aaosphaeria arxii CBS 175.79 TaxID=1450172 RepID=A0A6A5Y4C0_9PLEO|nr:uncharacterized protein BU24DRAFT_416099 [Aaosphaeria arxii CBS 175.79]KAF2020402.1 hypothetical protein BU24DRAFT_416099 [Aaosphaeria arxii CBS 175.79]